MNHSLLLLSVAAGGAIGAVARFSLARWLTALHGAEGAWSILAINTMGAFGLGLVVSVWPDRSSLWSVLLGVGALGAFTTFSTFALDAIALFEARGVVMAGLYVVLSVALAVAGGLLGLSIGKALVAS